jgi:hypothetical protein
MRLIEQTKQGLKYELNFSEGDCLQTLMQRFPFTAPVRAKISRTDTSPKSMERETLLNESLADHRKELKKQASGLLAPGRFRREEKGYLLTLGLEEREVLMQILNDIRVGCWHALGEPEILEPKTPPSTDSELAHYNLMNLAGYFEASLLSEEHDGLRPGPN